MGSFKEEAFFIQFCRREIPEPGVEYLRIDLVFEGS
jgi:hypothetical protein